MALSAARAQSRESRNDSVLAANTACSDFPRLACLLGRDKFLAHQFTLRGDPSAGLVGIVVLGIASSFVLWSFGGSIGRLIPLYAFGVFSAFTLGCPGIPPHQRAACLRGC